MYSSSGNPRESAIVRGKWLPTGTKPARGSNLVRGMRLEPGQMKSSERAVKAAQLDTRNAVLQRPNGTLAASKQ